MTVIEIFQRANASGLGAFLKRYSPSDQLLVREYFQLAMDRTPAQIDQDRWVSVVIPCGDDVFCLFRNTFMIHFHPTCASDLAKLENASDDERRYLRLKMARTLLLSHQALLTSRPSFGTPSFLPLLSAEVPEPLMDPDAFLESFLQHFCHISPAEKRIHIQFKDPITEAINLEKAFVQAYNYFLNHGPAIDSTVMSQLKEALAEDTVTPILIRSCEQEIQIRVLKQLLLYSFSSRDNVTQIKAAQLDDLCDQHLTSLCENYRVLMVSDFSSLFLTPDGEENMEELILNGVKLILFCSPEDLVFSSHLLNQHFANASYFDFDKEELK